MKIVHVIDQLGLGGAERVCINLVNLFNRNGFDVKLIVFNKHGQLFDLLDDDIKVSILDKDKGKIKSYKKLIKEIEGIDIVHVHMRQNYRFTRKALLFFGAKKKLIFHDHYGRIAINNRVPIFYKSLFKPDLFIGCSKLLTNWAIEKVKLEKEKVFLVNNFVLKYESNYSNIKGKGLVLVGNLKKVKNHKLAIDIAKKLNKELTIYCTSTTGDYYEDLITHIKNINYSNKIHFITGCNNVQTELKKYELALLTSTSEGDPLALVEYMAQGVPIKNYFPDFVLNNFNINDWINNYHKVINTPSNDIEKVYEENFSSKLFLDKYHNIYKEFINQTKLFFI